MELTSATYDAISDKLQEYLPVALYGQGEAKSWDSLLEEVATGECCIDFSSGVPVREIRVLSISVSDPDGNQLFEDRQVFSDGRIRRRDIWGVSEKVKPSEKVYDAAIRAIEEELGISPSQFSIPGIDPQIETEEKESPSYPGLLTRYIRYSASAFIDADAVKPVYCEEQPDKKTFFVWN